MSKNILETDIPAVAYGQKDQWTMDQWTMVNGPNGHHGHHGLWSKAMVHSPWCPLGPLTIVRHLSFFGVDEAPFVY